MPDVAACLAAFTRQWENPGGPVKIREDLDRYAAIIAATKPEMVIECGTHSGASARWFASHGLEVVTIDADPSAYRPDASRRPERITRLIGNSASPEIRDMAAGFAAGRRVMVSLDSDHSAEHVRREIGLYGPLVTPGCYLVVEDGIVDRAPQLGLGAGPETAALGVLAGDPAWERDTATEDMFPATMHLAGWWRRRSRQRMSEQGEREPRDAEQDVPEPDLLPQVTITAEATVTHPDGTEE